MEKNPGYCNRVCTCLWAGYISTKMIQGYMFPKMSLTVCTVHSTIMKYGKYIQMQTKIFGLFTTPSFTNFNIYCSIFTYLETTEWIFNLCACYNQFPFIFTNTFLDIMHEITAEVDGG